MKVVLSLSDEEVNSMVRIFLNENVGLEEFKNFKVVSVKSGWEIRAECKEQTRSG